MVREDLNVTRPIRMTTRLQAMSRGSVCRDPEGSELSECKVGRRPVAESCSGRVWRAQYLAGAKSTERVPFSYLGCHSVRPGGK